MYDLICVCVCVCHVNKGLQREKRGDGGGGRRIKIIFYEGGKIVGLRSSFESEEKAEVKPPTISRGEENFPPKTSSN